MAEERERFTWANLIGHYEVIGFDLLDHRGIDVEEPDFGWKHSWHWFDRQVHGLLTRPGTYQQFRVGDGLRTALVPDTRIGRLLNPIDLSE